MVSIAVRCSYLQTAFVLSDLMYRTLNLKFILRRPAYRNTYYLMSSAVVSFSAGSVNVDNFQDKVVDRNVLTRLHRLRKEISIASRRLRVCPPTQLALLLSDVLHVKVHAGRIH